MKSKITIYLKKQILIFIGLISGFVFSQSPNLEFGTATGDGNPTGNGPILSTTINFVKNTNNPSLNNFITYSPTLSATFTLSSPQPYDFSGVSSPDNASVFIGYRNAGAASIYPLMNTYGVASNGNFTSAGSSNGAGIDITANRAVGLYVNTAALRQAGVSTSSRTKVADLKISFNRAVNNPIVNFSGLGGNSGAQNFTTEFNVGTIFSSSAVTYAVVGGSASLAIQNTNQVNNLSNGTTEGNGSVRFSGLGITEINLEIWIRGDGGGSWAASNTSNTGDALMMSISTIESDLRVTKTVNNSTPLVGNNVVFTVTASNLGASNNTNVTVNDLLPSGYTYVSHTVSAGTYVPGTGVWNIGNLNDGATATLTVTATVKATGTYINTATISTTSGINDPDINNNTASVIPLPQVDSDGDGITDDIDLDDDNDGILDSVENGTCGIPNPNTAPGNGVITRTLFNENFGTMSTVNGTTSVSLAGLGTGATTTYNYYQAIAGTIPTDWNDGSGPPQSLDDGRYSVFNNIQQTAQWAATEWQTIGDHTNGGTTPTSGRMLIVNASYAPGEFYRRTLQNVVSSTPINASLWVMNLITHDGLINPNITIQFEQPAGNVIYSFNTGDVIYNNVGDVNAWKFFKNPTLFTPPTTQPIDIVLINNAPGGGGNDLAIDDIIVYQSLCDLDNDGIPNYQDTDSDGDGCADAIEGSENVKYNQIHALDLPSGDPNYAYRGQIKVTYNGTTTSTPSGIISTSPSANGVPQLLNNAGNNLNASTNPSNLAGVVDNTDGTADVGQGIGDSLDNTINSCKCYKSSSTDGNNYPTIHGITAFNRAGTDNQNWPMVRQSGWTALEASTKGFVINRMPVATANVGTGPSYTTYLNEPVNGIGTAVIISPIAGMMFYDTTNDCLKINVDGTRSGWKCFNNQSCPDEN